MTAAKRGYQPNPSYTQEDWDEVSDNPEWTAEDFKDAKPFKEVFPELYASWKRSRGEAKAATKELVSVHLDREVIEHFKAKGPRWQARINKALREAMRAEPKATVGAEAATPAPAARSGRRR